VYYFFPTRGPSYRIFFLPSLLYFFVLFFFLSLPHTFQVISELLDLSPEERQAAQQAAAQAAKASLGGVGAGARPVALLKSVGGLFGLGGGNSSSSGGSDSSSNSNTSGGGSFSTSGERASMGMTSPSKEQQQIAPSTPGR
jgi:hypothetical protein